MSDVIPLFRLRETAADPISIPEPPCGRDAIARRGRNVVDPAVMKVSLDVIALIAFIMGGIGLAVLFVIFGGKLYEWWRDR